MRIYKLHTEFSQKFWNALVVAESKELQMKRILVVVALLGVLGCKRDPGHDALHQPSSQERIAKGSVVSILD